jgi:hypothetical protein
LIKRQDLDNLSTYELNDLIIDSIAVALDLIPILLTLLFAYFTVAYVVGKKLSKLQLYSFTTVYSIFVLSGCGFSVILWMRADELLVHRDGVSSLAHSLTVPASTFLGWVLSIVFMIDCRNKNKL